MGEILLIAADWQLRALVRAQLLEEGYSVRALPSLRTAQAFLLRDGERPRATIVDTQGLEFETQGLVDLWRLTGQAPLIVCGGALNRAALGQEGWPPCQVLLRPFRVGDLVEQVQGIWACPRDEA